MDFNMFDIIKAICLDCTYIFSVLDPLEGCGSGACEYCGVETYQLYINPNK